MSVERTLIIIKPDAVRKNLQSKILSILKSNQLTIEAIAPINLKINEAKEFYKEHEGRPYFEPLVDFMLSGPVIVAVLEGEDAIVRTRAIMGSTKEPAEGTIRKLYAESVMHNCIHGSDSPASAEREIKFFFYED